MSHPGAAWRVASMPLALAEAYRRARPPDPIAAVSL